MHTNKLWEQSSKWPHHFVDSNGTATFAHDIVFADYVDPLPHHPFHGHHRQAEQAITRDFYERADHYLNERAERDGFAAPDCRVQFGTGCVGMQNRQAPEHAAKVHVYDVGATPRVQQPVLFEAHYGPLVLEVHVHPSCGVVTPPNVMSNEAVVLLQRPAPGESVKIGVKYMPTSGNILINETTDPNGIVLEARSGRFYPPAQIDNEELLSDPVRLAQATEQAQYSRTQREMLERAKLMRVINDELNPPQAPALVLNRYHTYDAAEQAQGLARSVYPPTSSASAQTPRSRMTMPGQHRQGGSGRAYNEKMQIDMQSRNDDQEFMANLSSMKRAKEAHRLASVALNRERRMAKLELKKKKELGALYVPPPEPRSRSCSPVKGRRRKNRSDESSSSDSETGDKEEEMQDN
jgi:hypothetical protein